MSQEELGALVRLRVDALKLHHACELVPEMTTAEWTEFLADVGRRGIQEPLVVDERDQILDGRHRHRAAGFAEIEFVLCRRRADLDEAEKTRFVLGAALHRRNLTIDQRAVLAAEYKQRLAKVGNIERASAAAEERWSHTDSGECLEDTPTSKHRDQLNEKPRARTQAATAFNVSERQVRKAETVVKNADPAIREAVKNGQITLACAKSLAQLPAHRQQVIASGGPAAMKQAARLAVHQPAIEDNETGGFVAVADERDERRERVERMAILQRFRTFFKEISDFRRGRGIDEALGGWPDDQLDELYDFADRIATELGIWTSSLEGGR